MDTAMEGSAPQDLLEGARRGDVAALTAIYDAHSPGLYRYACRVLGDPSLAEECLSETFARFLGALRDRRGPTSDVQAYLYRVAHNWITDTFRRGPPPTTDIEGLAIGDDAPSPEEQTSFQWERARTRRALARLTPDQRQVIVLHYVEEWDHARIAQVLGKPVGAVKSLQHRGLARLRRLMSREPVKCEE
jgi:RNA polymerase sigma-70 factor (ECF subfamily)